MDDRLLYSEAFIYRRGHPHLLCQGQNNDTTQEAYKFRKDRPNLICNPAEGKDDDMISITQSDFKVPPRLEKPPRGKREEIFERFLYDKVCKEIEEEMRIPEVKPEYITTTQQDYSVKGFDSSKMPCVTGENNYPLHLDTAVSFWSENKSKIQGVSSSCSSIPTFAICSNFTKPLSDRMNDLSNT